MKVSVAAAAAVAAIATPVEARVWKNSTAPAYGTGSSSSSSICGIATCPSTRALTPAGPSSTGAGWTTRDAPEFHLDLSSSPSRVDLKPLKQHFQNMHLPRATLRQLSKAFNAQPSTMPRKHHNSNSLSKAELRRQVQSRSHIDDKAEPRGRPSAQIQQGDHLPDPAIFKGGSTHNKSASQRARSAGRSPRFSPTCATNYLDTLVGISGREPPPRTKAQQNLGDLICFAIAFVAILGSLYALSECLLSAIRAQAACVPSTSTSTVYVPVTQTQTVTSISMPLPSSLEAAGVAASSSSSVSYYTITSTSISTNTVTVTPPLTEPVVASSSGGTSYLYYVTSGSTIWQNGVSPTSGAVLTYAITSIFVAPQPPAASDTTVTVHSTSTITQLTTITLPVYTSTVFSLMSTNPTTTLYSTQYSTVELSYAPSHSSFTGLNSGGWNVTSTSQSSAPTPEVTTLTQIVYHGHDNSTTATFTTRITATIGDVITQTVTPTEVMTAGATAVSTGLSITMTTRTLPPDTLTVTVGNAPSTISSSVGTSVSAGSAPLSAASPSALTLSGVVSVAQITTTIPLAPTTVSLLGSTSQSLATVPPSVSIGGSDTSTFATTTTNSSSVTFFTITSFISGHGTTFTLTSLPAETTPRITLVNGTASTLPVPTSITSSSSRGNGLPQTTAGSTSSNSLGSSLSAAAASSPSQPAASVSSSTMQESLTSRSTSTTSASSSSSGTPSSISSIVSTTSSRNSSVGSTPRPTQSPSSTATSEAATATQSCGEQGNFTMNFDNLPTFHSGSARHLSRQAHFWNASGNGTDITKQPPLSLRPYHHMLFSGGYVYSPQAIEPFAPSSPPNLAVFLANGTGLQAGQKPHGLEPGEIADGPYHEGEPAFFFHSYGAALGCDNAGPGDCTMEVTSYVWDNKTRDDIPSATQSYSIPSCPGFTNCQLTNVTFPRSFRNLSGLQIRAVKENEPRMFFVDDIQNQWADSSCAAGMKRQNDR